MQTDHFQQRQCDPSARAWWSGRVLLRVDGQQPAELQAAALQALASSGMGGLWLACGAAQDPATAQSLRLAQALGLPMLQDAPGLLQAQCLLDPHGGASLVHGRIAHALRLHRGRWPLWVLAQAQPEAQLTASAAALPSPLLRIAATLHLCLRGTPVLPLPAQAGADLLAMYPPLLQWRQTQPALLHGSMKLGTVHAQLLCLVREHQQEKVLCVFNFSDRYVREPLMPAHRNATLIPGSGQCGGRIINQQLDCDPWGVLFARLHGR